MVGGTLEYIEYRSQFLIIVVNLQPLEIISGGFLLQKWGLKMKKIFVAIVACMICNVGWDKQLIEQEKQKDLKNNYDAVIMGLNSKAPVEQVIKMPPTVQRLMEAMSDKK